MLILNQILFPLMFFSLIGERDSKERMSILDKEIQLCFDSYLEYNFYKVKSMSICLCHGASLKWGKLTGFLYHTW